MSREAQKYRDYARECLRQAEEAHTSERRDKLLELARVWADAALAIDVDQPTDEVSPAEEPPSSSV
jgi:hypothetical protein